MRRKYGLRIAGFVLKGLCTAFILSIVALLAWRIIDRNTDPRIIKTITPNETLCEAYEQSNGKLTLYHQEQNEYTQEDHNYGYFANGGTVIIDEADQLQFVLRYNNSTLKYTAADKSLAAIPSREEEVYNVTLLIMYDLTPENTEDNDGKTPEAVRYERIHPTGAPLTYQKTLYNYRKFTFDGVTIGKDVLAIYADVYYIGDKDYEQSPYGTLLLYYYEDELETHRLTRRDKLAIEEFAK